MSVKEILLSVVVLFTISCTHSGPKSFQVLLQPPKIKPKRQLAQDATSQQSTGQFTSVDYEPLRQWEMTSNLVIPKGSTLHANTETPRDTHCPVELKKEAGSALTHLQVTYDFSMRPYSGYYGFAISQPFPLEEGTVKRNGGAFLKVSYQNGVYTFVNTLYGAPPGYYLRHQVHIDPNGQYVTKVIAEVLLGSPDQEIANMAVQARLVCEPMQYLSKSQ